MSEVSDRLKESVRTVGPDLEVVAFSGGNIHIVSGEHSSEDVKLILSNREVSDLRKALNEYEEKYWG